MSQRLHRLAKHLESPSTAGNRMSAEYEYDLVTIGAGSGGVRASRLAAAAYGAKVR